jgi:3-hydroxyacyl-CoA dehydrogenase
MGSINDVVDMKVKDGMALVRIDSPPVNALSQPVREGMLQAIQSAAADSKAQAIIISCKGSTFIAGADINEFSKPPLAPSVYEVQDVMEQCTKPIVAVIHGTALGGGLEIALTCHYRVAVASAKCGFPEVKLGLLPGAGGTQRLPRVVGVERALEMVTSGQLVSAKESLELGLIDALVDEFDPEGEAITFVRKVIDEQRPLRKIRDLDDKLIAARNQPGIFSEFRKANARKFRGVIAPEYNIRCIEAAVNQTFDDGIATERKLFVELVQSAQSAAQRHLFFAEREAWKVPDVGGHTPILAIRKIGVVGAGTMGGGIAMNFLNANFPVTIVETTQEALDRGVSVIRKNYESTAKRGKLTQADVEKRIGYLKPSLSFDDLADCDLVIEAVYENMDVKKQVFAMLDAIVKPGAILATNTSALDVDEIAASIKRPESVIGLHFFSPANVMRLLEVVRAKETSKAVIATSMQLAKKLGKTAVLVGVCPGFVGNRMLFVRQAAADKLLLEGLMPWDIDRVLYDFGMPMGPYAMWDLAGLDLGLSKDASGQPSLQEILCGLGRKGQKTQAGYYDYDAERNPKPSAIVEQLVKEFVAKKGVKPRSVSNTEILERCLYPMINEGAKILDEGKALRAGDIDVVWVAGYGWPAYHGGPMWYANEVGIANVVEKLKQHGEVEVSPLLIKMATEGKAFS